MSLSPSLSAHAGGRHEAMGLCPPPAGEGASTNALEAAALAYAARGWRVLPLHAPTAGGCSCRNTECGSIGKHPRTRNGVHDATTDPATIRQWWSQWPEANVGIATGAESGVIVLDVDPRHGGDDSLADLARAYGPLPNTVEALTGDEGRHIYFAHPGGTVANSANKLGLGLDVRGDGGYVVAPPSLHKSGRCYQWEVSSHPDEVSLAAAPAWLRVEEVAPWQPSPQIASTTSSTPYGTAALRNEVAALASTQEGQRNMQLNQAALSLGRLVAAGHVSQQELEAALLQVATEIGLSEQESRATIRSGMEAGLRQPREVPPPAVPTRAGVATELVVEPSESRRFRLLSPRELKQLPPLEWLVKDLLFKDSLAVLVGPPEAFKTFVALDLHLSIASDLPWQGRGVQPGPTLFISGEGKKGLGVRVEAWEQAHGREAPEDAYFLPDAVQFLERGDVESLLAVIRDLPKTPVFLVVDTLARCFVGGDENSQKDMGLFINGVERIRKETGAAALVVHHENREGTIRGSSALPGALDTTIDAARHEHAVVLTCKKQKDAERFEPITLRTKRIELAEGNSSLVLEATDRVSADALSQNERACLVALQSFGPRGARNKDWKEAARQANVSESTFNRTLRELTREKLVLKEGARYRVAPSVSGSQSS